LKERCSNQIVNSRSVHRYHNWMLWSKPELMAMISIENCIYFKIGFNLALIRLLRIDRIVWRGVRFPISYSSKNVSTRFTPRFLNNDLVPMPFYSLVKFKFGSSSSKKKKNTLMQFIHSTQSIKPQFLSNLFWTIFSVYSFVFYLSLYQISIIINI